MAYRWGYMAVWRGSRQYADAKFPHPEFFESAQFARQHLQASLDSAGEATTEGLAGSLLRTAPDTAVEILVICGSQWAYAGGEQRAWAVFPVPDGLSAEQAGEAFCYRIMNDHRRAWAERWFRNEVIYNDRVTLNSGSGRVSNSGCVVVAVTGLGAVGALAGAWARSRWGL